MIKEKINWQELSEQFNNSAPFNHIIIDDFFELDIADQLSKDFPSYDSPEVVKYSNALENKRTLNQWDKFPPTTYKVFDWMGKELVHFMRFLVRDSRLSFDFGLNGGGWHMHSKGGNNNLHLDYSIHPKLGFQRKLNIIVYMTKDWDSAWGGGLELWSHDFEKNKPKKLIKTIDNKYNRAIIFDTTQNSWHGLPKYIQCPEKTVRKSIAGYFVTPIFSNPDMRGRALFAPREDQIGNLEIEELIRKRSDVNKSLEVYRK